MLSHSRIADIFRELHLETEEQRVYFRFAWPNETSISIGFTPLEPVPETHLGNVTEPPPSRPD